MEKKKFYITTPIYYPSAEFHIGHCYTTVIADAIARYKRLDGYDVFFQTGTDEHGQKIEKKAKEAGKTPKEFVDHIIEDAKDLWEKLGISYDYFIRTTDESHIKAVQYIFKKLYDQGDIYKGVYKGLYCTPCESFWTETQLIDGKCPDCNREVEQVEEEAYFLKLSKYQDALIKYYEENPDFIQPESRKNEMINNFIKPGLQDLCVSRTSFSWGVPVSFDDKHVVYVWLDALSNYITSLGYPDENNDLFKKYWPADLHLVGKEIVRFHVIIWPIILMALNISLPKKVFGHGWLIIDGGKISKSSGNYEDPRVYIEKYGLDALRYYILREVPFGNDGNFSVDYLINRTNADLANTLGNLVNRSISMGQKYFNGLIHKPTTKEEIDIDLINSINNLKMIVNKKIDELKVNEALESIFDVLKKCNKYIDDTTPWTIAKDETKTERLNAILYNLLEGIRVSSILLEAFIPTTSKRIYSQLNISNSSFNDTSYGLIDNYSLNKPEILFNRIMKEDN